MNTRDFWFNQPHAKSELDHRAAEAVDKIDNMSAETERPIAARSSSRNVAIRFLPGKAQIQIEGFLDFRLGYRRGFVGFRLQADAVYPQLELSNNLAENSMRPIAIGRGNWIHIGSEQAGPRVAAILSVRQSHPQGSKRRRKDSRD